MGANGQLDFALDLQGAQVSDPVAWLAPLVLSASELCSIHRGDLDGARSSASSGGKGSFCRDHRFEVSGSKVTWSRGDNEGVVTVKALIHYAAGRHDPAIGDALIAAYRAYVQAATTRYTLARGSAEYEADPEGNEARAQAAVDASRSLDRAAAAWWTAEPPGTQFALFEAAIPRPRHAARATTPSRARGVRHG